ncbi:glycoside hydrolase domain-containing protein [Mycobacterium sp. ITM-2016-00317]|uniref:glycoside hydrolase domain-containing protein n=1 Tax=Mycobacterium sp. ITM-2016-00317 TaxID=2099694 RepID=UPI0037CBEEED
MILTTAALRDPRCSEKPRSGYLASRRATGTPDVAGNYPSPPVSPSAAPVYASFDDDRTFDQDQRQVAPYPQALGRVPGHRRLGGCANSNAIEWATHDGLGSCFWQRNWGSPDCSVHAAARSRQVEIDTRTMAGLAVVVSAHRRAAPREVGLTRHRLTRQ